MDVRFRVIDLIIIVLCLLYIYLVESIREVDYWRCS